jgi:hypothetical protein
MLERLSLTLAGGTGKRLRHIPVIAARIAQHRPACTGIQPLRHEAAGFIDNADSNQRSYMRRSHPQTSSVCETRLEGYELTEHRCACVSEQSHLV